MPAVGAALVALATVATAPRAAAQVVVKGRVVNDSTHAPVADAEVLIHPGGPRFRTDQQGYFLIRDLAPGYVELVARAIGFQPRSVLLELFPGDTLELAFELHRRVVVLAPIEVYGTRENPSARLVEFDRRRAMGFGNFLTRAQLAKWENQPLSNALRQLAHVGLVYRLWKCGGGFAVATLRGGASPNGGCTYGGGCFLAVYVDGVRAWTPGDGGAPNIDQYLTERLEAIEVYRGPAETPIEYQATGNSCGAILLWTRISSPN